jgi:hypothetical protein
MEWEAEVIVELVGIRQVHMGANGEGLHPDWGTTLSGSQPPSLTCLSRRHVEFARHRFTCTFQVYKNQIFTAN